MSGSESLFELVPLDCPTCGAALHAEGADVVYYCTACRNGYSFDDDERSVHPVEVGFIAAPNVAVAKHLPFWILPARIEISVRRAKGAGFSGLLRVFATDSRPRGPGAGEGTFAVPAFHCSLDALTRLTRAYSERASDPAQGWGELIGERLVGGRYGIDDARKLAHYSLIAGEVDQPDTLRQLRYRIDFDKPRLLGVPFTRSGDGLVDAHFGIPV